jgi:hypothetical protein
MYAHEPLASRIGPTARAVGIFVSAFVVLWAITPYLTASSTQASPRATSGVTVTPATTIAPSPTPTAPVADTVTRIASGEAEGFNDMATWDGPSFDFVLPPGWPDTLEPSGDLTFVVQTGDAGALVDRSPVEWSIEVTNISDERLWGLFVYMEYAGRADCDRSILDPGRAATCTVEDVAYAGDSVADVWATAWNIDAVMSADRILQPYTVAE